MMTDEIASRVLKSLSNHIWKMCEILLFFNTLRILQDKKTKKAVNMIEL